MNLTKQQVLKNIDQIKKWIEETEKEPQGAWRAEEGEEYFCVISDGNVLWSPENGCTTDDYRYLTGNYFKTKEEAEDYREYLMARCRITRYCQENHPFKPDCENSKQQKWYPYFDHDENIWDTFSDFCYVQELKLLPYLPSEEACEDVIENCKEDLEIVRKYQANNN